MLPVISICIPAYKNVTFLKRLLDSICLQTYRSFEVIISDDSPDGEVEQLVENYEGQLPFIYYVRNQPAKGMPENWNNAISFARGEWIKIMHDDDWFLNEQTLAKFAEKINTEADFIFSNYENTFLNQQDEIVKKVPMVFPKYRLSAIAQEPLLLLADNKVGPPSVCMVRASVGARYDTRLRWRVDIDYYKAVLSENSKMELLEDLLVGVGMNENQVTNQTKNIPSVELPEAYILLQKYGTGPLRNWIIYDSWWRMMRNLKVTSYEELRQVVPEEWPLVIKNLLDFMEKTPKVCLKIGVMSKLFMFLSFGSNKGLKR